MKLITYLPFLFLLSICIVLPSCNKDDDDNSPGQNEFELNGEILSLSQGFIEDFGDNGNGSFDFDVSLTSSGVTYDSGNQTFGGVGNFIYLDLNTSSATGLDEGTYTFSATRAPLTLVDGLVAKDFNVVSLTGTSFSVTGGTVEVELNGTEVTITFNLIVTGGSTVTGSFKGVLQVI